MQARWTPDISLLGRCHLAILGLCAGYIALTHPMAQTCVLTMAVAAVFSEAMPPVAKRWLVGEALLIATGALTWWHFAAGRPDVLDGWLRMLVAYWLLIPSRPGLMRWTLSLILAEAIALGSGRIRVSEWSLGTGLWGLPASLALPLFGLLPIAAASLALDAWASARVGARSRNMPSAVMRFALMPAMAIVLVTLAIAPFAIPHGEYVQPRLPATTAQTGIRKPSIAPGEHQWIVHDPSPKGRLLWEDENTPLVDGVAYIRAFTLPHLIVDGAFVRWEAEALDHLRRGEGGFDERRPFAWIVRLPMGNDAVLHLEPGFGVDLIDLLGDLHGNRYQSRIDDAPRAYRVNLDPVELGDKDDPTYRELPAGIINLPWSTLIDAEWENLDARAAAEAVTRQLNRLCMYDLKNLPKPAAREAGLLHTFLWSDAAADRRGHCQYFSTAAAIMLRVLGHPTRCAAGFATNERTNEGYTFRGLHAHAWIEVQDESGRWFRCDPTPAGHLETRMGEPIVTGDSEMSAPPNLDELRKTAEQAAQAQARRRSMVLAPIIVLSLAVLGFIAWRVLRRRVRQRRNPLRAHLDREAASLERLASEWGIAVTPSTTLSELAKRLSERSGLDLDEHLRAHLLARYGQGPLPAPWPINDLRAAVRRRSQAESPSGQQR